MRLDWLHHHRERDAEEAEPPVWQATKPVWGEVRIDAPRAGELAHRTPHAA